MGANDITHHLVHFARDQLATIKGWQGEAYVERCLTLWEQEYGRSTADQVRAALELDAPPARGAGRSRHGRG